MGGDRPENCLCGGVLRAETRKFFWCLVLMVEYNGAAVVKVQTGRRIDFCRSSSLEIDKGTKPTAVLIRTNNGLIGQTGDPSTQVVRFIGRPRLSVIPTRTADPAETPHFDSVAD